MASRFPPHKNGPLLFWQSLHMGSGFERRRNSCLQKGHYLGWGRFLGEARHVLPVCRTQTLIIDMEFRILTSSSQFLLSFIGKTRQWKLGAGNHPFAQALSAHGEELWEALLSLRWCLSNAMQVFELMHKRASSILRKLSIREFHTFSEPQFLVLLVVSRLNKSPQPRESARDFEGELQGWRIFNNDVNRAMEIFIIQFWSIMRLSTIERHILLRGYLSCHTEIMVVEACHHATNCDMPFPDLSCTMSPP